MKIKYEGWTLGALALHIMGWDQYEKVRLDWLLLYLMQRSPYDKRQALIKELVTIVERAAAEKYHSSAELLPHCESCMRRLAVACDTYQRDSFETPTLTPKDAQTIADLCMF